MDISPFITGSFGLVAAMPVTYVVLWFASLASSITLVVLLRTRWGQTRPLHKCAVLSLIVHLLLAWAAMTVRIVAGTGNGGSEGPAIRVRVVGDPNGNPKVARIIEDAPLAAAPPLLELPPEEVPAQPEAKLAETPTEVASNEVPPEPVAEDPKPEPVAEPIKEVAVDDADPKIVEAETVAPAEQPAVSTPPPTPAVAAEPVVKIESDATQPRATPVVATRPLGDPNATTPYSLRNLEGRLGLVEQEGGSGHTEAAVEAALRWLAAAQSRDGRWDANAYGAGQEQMVLGQNRGGAGRNADTGISALALLAFLGAGHSHQHGEYQDTVKRGLDFLLRSQAADGSLFGNATLYAQMYCHSMATFALAEAQAMTGDRRLEPAVTKAVSFSVTAQNTSVGGWRYRPGDPGDTSQLGWQVMALFSTEQAGIEVPSQTWQRIDRFLLSVRRGERGGLASYRTDGPASTSMTAEALYCRLLSSEVNGGNVDQSAVTEATNKLLSSLPTAERINLYYWYYATLALHHRHRQNEAAADAWDQWNQAMTETLVTTQIGSGANAGSWETNTVWGGYGGRVYTTAMAAMCLEVYYRYAPTPSDPPVEHREWTATRPQTRSPGR